MHVCVPAYNSVIIVYCSALQQSWLESTAILYLVGCGAPVLGASHSLTQHTHYSVSSHGDGVEVEEGCDYVIVVHITVF